MGPLVFLSALAAQQPGPPAGVDPVVWPYWVAIGGLASAVAALFTALMRTMNDHRKENEERSVRISAEFEKKDAAILDIATRITEATTQFTAAIDKLTDKSGGLVAEVRAGLERVGDRLDRIERKINAHDAHNREDR